MSKQRIILGIDPGTVIMGFGVVKQVREHVEILHYESIHLSTYATHALKLQKIFQHTLCLVKAWEPDEVALEAPFYGKNVQAMLKLGRAQGVAMAAALAREVSITEYAPRKVKQAITGNGHASKEQVAQMLAKMLRWPDLPGQPDATDALAVAVCHAYQDGKVTASPCTWGQWLQKNPTRMMKS
ncbi:MAG: crossover junction endodeoxyribonuclease RuvC [Bacteroidota bacterium]